jgi:hypothetical protein
MPTGNFMSSTPTYLSEDKTIVKNTQVLATPGFFRNLLFLWMGMSWLSGRKHPERSWLIRLLSGALSGCALVFADVGHAFAHTLSARIAGEPMDQIKLSSSMTRTIYFNDEVPPRGHIMRALGGPIFSALGSGISLLVRSRTPRNTMAREVVDWSSVGHGLIFIGSLIPLPLVDGGSILKWTLVENGRAPAEADHIVKQAGVVTGITVSSAGAIPATRRRWLPAAGLFAAGLVFIGAALGKIR